MACSRQKYFSFVNVYFWYLPLPPAPIFCTNHTGRHGLTLSRTSFAIPNWSPPKSLCHHREVSWAHRLKTALLNFRQCHFCWAVALFPVTEATKPVLSILSSKTGLGLTSLLWLWAYSQTFWGSLSSLDWPSVSIPLLCAPDILYHSFQISLLLLQALIWLAKAWKLS